MKKVSALLVVLALLMTMCTTALASYMPGTYVGTGNGRNGLVKVEVTFDENGATAAQVIESVETAGVGDAPIAQIPAKFIETQSLNLDVVSGATLTSNAILEAIADAVA